jgi:hypothetical protein
MRNTRIVRAFPANHRRSAIHGGSSVAASRCKPPDVVKSKSFMDAQRRQKTGSPSAYSASLCLRLAAAALEIANYVTRTSHRHLPARHPHHRRLLQLQQLQLDELTQTRRG